MGFFDFLFYNTGKKINRKKFGKALKELSDLSSEERAYVEAAFGKELSNGYLTDAELRKRIEQLRKNYKDSLDSWEVEHLKNKLSGKIKEE